MDDSLLRYMNSQKSIIDLEESKIDEDVELRVRMLFPRSASLLTMEYRQVLRSIYQRSVAKKRRALKKLKNDLEELYKRYDQDLL